MFENTEVIICGVGERHHRKKEDVLNYGKS